LGAVSTLAGSPAGVWGYADAPAGLAALFTNLAGLALANGLIFDLGLPRYTFVKLAADLGVAGASANVHFSLRDFGDGFVAVLLPVYLLALGFSPLEVGIIATASLLGSALLNGVRLTVSTIAVVTGDARFAPALRRSATLTRGKWLRTLGVIVTISLIALAVAITISSIGLAFPEGTAAAVGSSAFGLIGNALTVPIVALGSYRLYRALEAQASARRAA
jgi:hypothetical protein